MSVATETYSSDEMMAVEAARRVPDGSVCFVGIGLPSLAINLARRTTAPNCVLVYESGTIGAKPDELPLSIGDGELAETADAVVSVPEMFAQLAPGGAGLTSASSARRRLTGGGTSTAAVIGDYDRPKVRLPGGGGAPEIALGGPRRLRDAAPVAAHVRRATRLHRRASGSDVHLVVTDLGVLVPEGRGS